MTSRNCVLIVEDDQTLAEMVAGFLDANGYTTSIADCGVAACELVSEKAFDAIILDIGLPDIDGIEVCRRIRGTFPGPIIVLTARGDEIDEVVALEVGADDYMAKPVRPRALLARLKTHLRKTEPLGQADSAAPVEVGQMRIDPATREVWLQGEPISLTTAEFDLLWLLAQRAGTAISRAELYERLNGIKFHPADRSIDLRVSRLRRKLKDSSQSPSLIKSVRGFGYLLAVRT